MNSTIGRFAGPEQLGLYVQVITQALVYTSMVGLLTLTDGGDDLGGQGRKVTVRFFVV